LLVGPVFTREVTTTPRSWRHYLSRALYVSALFGLVLTAWLILIGSQQVRSLGDLSRFGSAVFALLAPLQMAMAVMFSALLTAAAVAQEKDRRTLDLLLMTNLSNSELVLGKLLASMLSVLVLVVAAIPLLMLITLLGGVSFGQVARVVAVTLTAAAVAGSLGSMIALWREKTFQSLALTALLLMFWVLFFWLIWSNS
jgi:ABC-type transport system involved in multi-copper enzyme maturation permease subunit